MLLAAIVLMAYCLLLVVTIGICKAAAAGDRIFAIPQEGWQSGRMHRS